eukprot:sb/3465631/
MVLTCTRVVGEMPETPDTEILTDEDKRNAIITTITLDVSNKHLKEVPKTIKNFTNIEFLYLSNNDIKTIPDNFFQHLPQLKWLDFRHNLLVRIPAAIGDHRELRTLLLQGNKIQTLPIEIGNIPTLTGLNIADNPLSFPPGNILTEGTQKILQFLRQELKNENLLLPELEIQLGDLSVTDQPDNGYLGRKHANANHNLTNYSRPRPTPGGGGAWELSYHQRERHGAPPSPLCRTISSRLPARSRTSLGGGPTTPDQWTKRSGAILWDSPVQNRKRPTIRSSSTRLFEFVPLLKPKRSTKDIRSKSIDLGGLKRREMVLEAPPRPTFVTARSFSREKQWRAGWHQKNSQEYFLYKSCNMNITCNLVQSGPDLPGRPSTDLGNE